MWAADRRRSLLDAAARLLDERGIDAVRIPDVAAEAGVTRPIVYKFFANRQAIIIGLLEDFFEAIEARYQQVRDRGEIGLVAALREVIGATCDLIEEKGAGAWRLLGTTGPDPEVEEVAKELRARMLTPWLDRIAETTDAPELEVRAVARMSSIITRGVLDLWIDGEMSREQAVAISMRGVGAIVREFAAVPLPEA